MGVYWVLLRKIEDEVKQGTPHQHNCFFRGGGYWHTPLEGIIASRIYHLRPTTPTDGSSGFIAYEAEGDKPRIKLKTGRFLTRKLKLNNGFLTDKQIRNIAEAVNYELFPDFKVELLKGEAITKAYRDAVGSSSCMTEGNAEYTRMYEHNPDRFQLLVMFWQNDSSRAIVHKLDNGRFLLGRIYHSCSALYTKMNEYATEYFGEPPQSTDRIMSNLIWEDGCVPYQDTLTNYRVESNGKLTIFACDYNSRSHPDGTLDGTCGTIRSRCTCDSCECSVCEDDAYSTDSGVYCEDCYSDLFSSCDCCGDVVLCGDIACAADDKYVCPYCLDDRYTKCDDCSIYRENDNMVVIEDAKTVCADCSENYSTCDQCGKYMLYDGRLCESCSDDYGICGECGGVVDLDSIEDEICSDCAVEEIVEVSNENN